MVWFSRELGIIAVLVIVQGVYQLLFEYIRTHSDTNSAAAKNEIVDDAQVTSRPTARILARLEADAVSAAASKAAAKAKDERDEKQHQEQVSEIRERLQGGTLRDGNDDHLRGFPSDPQASVKTWGEAYKAHLECAASANNSVTGVWSARARHYDVDPIGGDSWGVSITGAQLFAIGRDVIIHGGWDDETSSRDGVFAVDVAKVVHTDRLAPVRVSIKFAEGLRRSKCPGPAYGHTVTPLGGYDFLVIGGVRYGGYRGVLNHWGVFRLSRVAGRKPWELQWIRCGHNEEAQRAFHTATLVHPGTNVDTSTSSYVLLCGGSTAKVPVALFEPSSRRFSRLETHVACQRAGHSALAVGSEVIILGGTDHTAEGMPWYGRDLHDIYAFDGVSRKWLPPIASTAISGIPKGALSRQHVSVMTEPGIAVVLAGGLGGFGGGDVVLLNFTALRSNPGSFSDKEAASAASTSQWTRKLPAKPLPNTCGDEATKPVKNAMPSANIPPLRGHAAAWTGTEVVVFGGSVMERVGYHGMMLVRLV